MERRCQAISRKGSEAILEIAAIDYPRLLSIEYPTHSSGAIQCSVPGLVAAEDA